MEVVMNDELKRPIKTWTTDLDYGAISQAKHLAMMPSVYSHVALMPDAHMGYGMPIGGVIATQDIVIPNAVGVDIGCGVCAVKLPMNRRSHPDVSIPELLSVITAIRGEIPVGFKKHNIGCNDEEMPAIAESYIYQDMPVIFDEYKNAKKSLGTLGGGNHFIEIQSDEMTNIWIMVHSGSRNLGKKVADHHNKIAVELNESFYSSVPKKWELAFLPLYSKEADIYMREMHFCVHFAKLNRMKMMRKIIDIFYRKFKLEGELDFLDIAHNYAKMEHHYGKNVMVHRKGATRARKGERGVIPGSQGTKSYIVEGKGNPLSFQSCSHGAGRAMGRNEARKKLNLKDEVRLLEDQGIIHSIRSEKDLDEASSAYKDIDVVMSNQKDLVDIVHTLQPLAVIKG